MILRMNAIERSLLVEAVRLLERAARGENVRLSAERFIAPLEIKPTDELDHAGKPIERVFLKAP
ncbi:MAG: hypothetical protein ACLQJR_08315 [Stellaceae bacterium]